MAKSIYDILKDLETETSVPVVGKSVSHTLPRSLFPTDTQFENAQELLAWANENGFTHALLQMGVQKGLIDIRASFKSCKKDETWSEELGQANVDKFKWSVTTRPNQTGGKAVSTARFADCLGMIGNLLEAGLDKNAIRGLAVKTYGDDIVSACFEALANASK